MNTHKVTTININGITNRTKIQMFEDFIKRHGIDIALIQEITQPQIEKITGYQTLLNIGSEMRGTGMMIKMD
jgi:exonuclease III